MLNDFNEFIELEKQQDYYIELEKTLMKQRSMYDVFPPTDKTFACFEQCPYQNVNVVILGQDPYHDDGQANGLAFSVNKGVKIPPSLMNMYKELRDDLGYDIPSHGDLSAWSQQGVLLLNTVLSVRAHEAASHKNMGWEIFTDHVIQFLNQRSEPIVFVLWGKHAQNKKKMIDSHHFIIESAHPSPLSAYRGFFGSQPFSKINQLLIDMNRNPIDWRIEDV